MQPPGASATTSVRNPHGWQRTPRCRSNLVADSIDGNARSGRYWQKQLLATADDEPCDDRQSALGNGEEVLEVHTGGVLGDPVEHGQQPAVRQRHLETQHHVTHGAESNDAAPAGVCGSVAPDLTGPLRARPRRKFQSSSSTRLCNSSSTTARLIAGRATPGVKLLNGIELRERQRDLTPIGVAPPARPASPPCTAAGCPNRVRCQLAHAQGWSSRGGGLNAGCTIPSQRRAATALRVKNSSPADWADRPCESTQKFEALRPVRKVRAPMSGRTALAISQWKLWSGSFTPAPKSTTEWGWLSTG